LLIDTYKLEIIVTGVIFLASDPKRNIDDNTSTNPDQVKFISTVTLLGIIDHGMNMDIAARDSHFPRKLCSELRMALATLDYRLLSLSQEPAQGLGYSISIILCLSTFATSYSKNAH
jgi:hypothetical protein